MTASQDFATLPGNTYAAAPRAPRLDFYTPIHKALRAFMGHVLVKVGTLDVDDDEERASVLDGVDTLLAFMRSHLQHENDFVHTAIEARRPGAARHTADDHLMHAEAFGNLEDEARALRHARPEHRAALALRLYRHLSEFIGENLVHMQVEETQNNATLWELYSDDELCAIHDRLLASIDPAEMALVVRWMASALSVPELAGLFADMRQKAPPAAFDALLDIARAQLAPARWRKLALALDLPPHPGLMTC